MGLKLSIEKLDDVEEAHRGLYVEKDGKFQLEVDGVEDVAPLKGALNKERQTVKEQKKIIDNWKRVAGDKAAEDIEALIAEHAELKEKIEAGHDKKTLDQIRKDAVEAANRDNEKKLRKLEEEKNAALAGEQLVRRQYETSTINAAIASALAEHKGNPDVLLRNIRPFVRAKYEDGRMRLVVVKEESDDAEERLNPKGDLLTVSEMVAEMAQDEKWAANFAGSGTGGGGAPPRSGSGGGPKLPAGIRTKRDLAGDKSKTYAQKFDEFIRSFPTQELGLAAYEKLPD